MDKAIASTLLATVMLLLVLHSKAEESQWVSHHHHLPQNLPPLCGTQFMLANRACSLLPYEPVPPPSPPFAPPLPPVDSHHHHHGHRHKKHRHKETAIEHECCRWLSVLDDACVCGMLVHLAPFLTRPAHNFSVSVYDLCQVTYSCSSRFKPL